ncbi:MAG: DNA topoisomerase 3 [Verrucomicrobia subdivision 3 bacterium]|nr:DNA topoisomerase 3 [Limisphaerales bacterium]MCS1414273.1 DNA topoisomerase 3 [Limisphaerales bacterium]
MGKSLVIAEKPSVASDIAKAIGGFTRHDDYFENDAYLISSAIGHLLEITVPPESEVKRGKWTFMHLPQIPPHFDLRPIPKTASRLNLLKRLIKRKDIDTLINACDAGREGELIFRYIIQHAKTKKPVKRLWLQSMTKSAIRDGFTKLRTDEALIPLANAAICRSESDWLVGINGTRAMTAFNSKSGGFHLTTVGRVQTPTLTILVEREEKIKKFKSRKYWEVHAVFQAQAGTYKGRWFDEKFDKAKKEKDSELRPERIWERDEALKLVKECEGEVGIATEESKPSYQQSPLLFDLTSLQREANSRFSLPAARTLQIAQVLYERHKLITYPRTDSRALPEDYLAMATETLKAFEQSEYEAFSQQILSQSWVKPNKRIFNNSKISDHFAIIPTSIGPKKLNKHEGNLYDLITCRFLAVFYPAAKFLLTTRTTRVGKQPFKTEGKVLVTAGWLAVYGKKSQDDGKPNLTPIEPEENVHTIEIETQEFKTKPPPHYTEATLLSAMEGAGKLVDDEELRAAMSTKGLGTPATRAAIIDELIKKEYLIRNARDLQPTAKAFSLITLLRGLGIPELCSPDLTGNWEYELNQMEQGHLQRDEFMAKIRAMTEAIVEKAKSHESDTVSGDFDTLKTPCPKCGTGTVKETYKNYQCGACDFFLWKIVSGRQLESHEMEELLTNRTLGPLQGFRSKQGRLFPAIIKLTNEFKAEFDFGNKEEKSEQEAPDFSGKETLGACPKCKAKVYDAGMNYVCEKSIGSGKSCAFQTGKIILQREIPEEQVKKLLANGKTDLLDRFISKKTGRAFNAFLVLGKNGKVGFEFEPRAAKKKSAKVKPAKEPATKVDLTGKKPIGNCPRCGGGVYDTEAEYICEHSQKDEKPCKFKSGKIICQQPVERTQMVKLLTNGRTDMLDKFVSRRGFPFTAALILEDSGKVGFKFAPRDTDSNTSAEA